eukprot:7293921-Prymnesium_polylepis.1
MDARPPRAYVDPAACSTVSPVECARVMSPSIWQPTARPATPPEMHALAAWATLGLRRSPNTSSAAAVVRSSTIVSGPIA